MKRFLLLFVLAGLLPARAAVDGGAFPDGTVWYLHADLARMRAAESGRDLYRWLDGEIFVEINDEIGIDLNKEVDRVTAYSHGAMGTVIVVEGPIAKETRDKVLALVALESAYDPREYDGKTYYFVSDEQGRKPDDGPLSDLDDAAFFSFDVQNKLLVASEEAQMHELLQNNGRIVGSASHDGALFVLSADREFVQAGMRTERFIDDDDDWDSNILRNTEEITFLLSDRDGMMAIEARLKSRDARMAESIGSIANGLLSLQLFNSELDPQIKILIQSTKVEVLDTVLTISTVFRPDALIQLLDDHGS